MRPIAPKNRNARTNVIEAALMWASVGAELYVRSVLRMRHYLRAAAATAANARAVVNPHESTLDSSTEPEQCNCSRVVGLARNAATPRYRTKRTAQACMLFFCVTAFGCSSGGDDPQQAASSDADTLGDAAATFGHQLKVRRRLLPRCTKPPSDTKNSIRKNFAASFRVRPHTILMVMIGSARRAFPML